MGLRQILALIVVVFSSKHQCLNVIYPSVFIFSSRIWGLEAVRSHTDAQELSGESRISVCVVWTRLRFCRRAAPSPRLPSCSPRPTWGRRAASGKFLPQRYSVEFRVSWGLKVSLLPVCRFPGRSSCKRTVNLHCVPTRSVQIHKHRRAPRVCVRQCLHRSLHILFTVFSSIVAYLMTCWDVLKV